ncbi:DUF4439 domain-containing protein [Brachybacterium sp. FME24]|uniref:DUF4439 domain-containing protein n=1 Tax=Brachybacterium sp. FME24 TaxID=2742605 RepID=UPI00271466E0|nr:DUF4439 domain-containing protein [Brachybacterium sp. FME24]
MLPPDDHHPAARALTRRRVLRSGAAGALGLLTAATSSACGPIRLGGPETYTPPPPGIDDLYRIDLLAVLDRAVSGADALVEAVGGDLSADPALSSALAVLVSALPAQRSALLTGAQAEREQAVATDPAPDQTPSPAPADAPSDGAEMVAVLVELRDLATDAARQVSGSLARPVAAIAAHTAWSVRRFHLAAHTGEVPALRTAEQIEPSREIPTTDPPSVGAATDYHSTIERAQQEEWYAGYVHEVLAARTSADESELNLTLSERHRARAEALGALAEQDDAPVVPRQAVYALPGGTLDEQMAAELPTLLAQGLLVDHVALVGAAPFARRPLSIVAAMEEAEVLVGLAGGMQPLPSLEVEDPAVSDGG